ncbi:MAG: DUF2147 domain-containing protein [Bacteroidales bacterium]|nr:DUF2147 domain-containing protein [Bacteroidales bacterium]
MKKLFVISFMLMGLAVQAQNADVILGKWFNEEKDAIIKIYEDGGKYTGKIVWLKEPFENGKPKVDDKNPDPKLQTRPVMGMKLFWGFTYDPDEKEWTDGRIYDPKSGKTYDCYMWMDGSDLKIKGYVMGMKFLGRKTTWTRAE